MRVCHNARFEKFTPITAICNGGELSKKRVLASSNIFNQGVMSLSYLCISTILVGAISTFLRST